MQARATFHIPIGGQIIIFDSGDGTHLVQHVQQVFCLYSVRALWTSTMVCQHASTVLLLLNQYVKLHKARNPNPSIIHNQLHNDLMSGCWILCLVANTQRYQYGQQSKNMVHGEVRTFLDYHAQSSLAPSATGYYFIFDSRGRGFGAWVCLALFWQRAMAFNA